MKFKTIQIVSKERYMFQAPKNVWPMSRPERSPSSSLVVHKAQSLLGTLTYSSQSSMSSRSVTLATSQIKMDRRCRGLAGARSRKLHVTSSAKNTSLTERSTPHGSLMTLSSVFSICQISTSWPLVSTMVRFFCGI